MYSTKGKKNKIYFEIVIGVFPFDVKMKLKNHEFGLSWAEVKQTQVVDICNMAQLTTTRWHCSWHFFLYAQKIMSNVYV